MQLDLEHKQINQNTQRKKDRDQNINQKSKENPMRAIIIDKVVLNIGAGKEQANIEKALKLLKRLTGLDAVKTHAKKRIPTWGLRPGMPVGCKKTLRNGKALEVLKLMLKAKDDKLSEKNFDDYGNINFGIDEYITLPGVKYDPEIGIIGLQISVALARRGYRVKNRRIKPSRLGRKHIVSKQDAIGFFKSMGVEVE